MTFSTDDGSIYLLFVFGALPILIVFPLVARAISRFRLRRLYHARTILAMYESPAGLTPAEIGYLYDAKLKTNELVATVFDLEYKNVIAIDETGELSRIAVAAEVGKALKAHENFVMNLIDRGEYRSLFQDLTLLHSQLFKNAVSQSLVTQGLMQPHLYQRLFTGAIKMTGFVFIFFSSLVILFLAMMQYAASSSLPEILFVATIALIAFTMLFTPLYICLGVVLTYIYVQIDGMRWIGTGLLKRTWPDIEGYRMYIEQAQLNRLNFASEELRAKALEKDFSYAVALRMRLDWKSRFSER